MQQYPYVKQLFEKNKRVRKELGRHVPLGAEEAAIILPTVPSPLEFNYRTSTKLCLNEDEEGQRSIGLYERARKRVIDIPQCPVHHPAINKLVQKLFGKKAKLPAPFYNHLKRGFQEERLKFVTVRHCPETDMFGLVISHTGVPSELLQEWAMSLRLTNIAMYECVLTKRDEDLVLSRNISHLAGEKLFKFVCGANVFLLDPLAFFQANSSLLVPFVEHITAGLEGERLWDLYGGYGAYSFAVKDRFKSIDMVETNENAVKAAKEAALQSNFKHLTTYCQSAENFLAAKLRPPHSDVSHLIVNPPRSGLSPHVIDGLIDKKLSRLRRLHYVSCSIETLNRDLNGILRRGGFKVESITPFDMFPQTDHIEVVAKLVR